MAYIFLFLQMGIPSYGMNSVLTLSQIGGYKGYGLALMVEVFCGILADATWGPNIRSWQVHLSDQS